MNPCGNDDCCVSTGICGRLTFGSGYLDDHGYWECPCDVCARAWKAENPAEDVWPMQKILNST
ncbi:hypothetical protein C4588_03595 [Candidatus Parcubacteria bacterium]|nr:MAG: hypothetical protein C4588_03595 [Candidatus Parcubacteria bacterium]